MEQNQIREVTRDVHFSGANKPTVTVKKNMIRFSAYCLRKLPNVDNVLFVMCPLEKRLVIEPCIPGERDAIRWSSKNPENRKPKFITCKEFYRRLCKLMEWREDCRYTIVGKVTGEGDAAVIVFDLTSALVYHPNVEKKIPRTPEYPKEWREGFGMPEEGHRNNALVKCFPEDKAFPFVPVPDLSAQENFNGNTEDGYERQL